MNSTVQALPVSQAVVQGSVMALDEWGQALMAFVALVEVVDSGPQVVGCPGDSDQGSLALWDRRHPGQKALDSGLWTW